MNLLSCFGPFAWLACVLVSQDQGNPAPAAQGKPLATIQSPSTGMSLKQIPAGYFSMGVSSRLEGNSEQVKKNEKEHTVYLSKSIYVSVYEVTQKDFEKIMEKNPSYFSAKGNGNKKVQGKQTDLFPVESVTWFDAVEFCNRLSVKDGLEPYYKVEASDAIPIKIKPPVVSIKGGKGYRLPTEAEWEYACRAGTTSHYSFGNDMIGEDGNTQPILSGSGYGAVPKWNSLTRTEKVGSYRPNKWGLYDMSGNVSEWCWDWYGDGYYDVSPLQDPQGPDFGKLRVIRGGSWVQNAVMARSASRFWQPPTGANYFIGIRVVRDP